MFAREPSACAAAVYECCCGSGEDDEDEEVENPAHADSKEDDVEQPKAVDDSEASLAELENPRFALEGKLEAYEGTFDDYAEIVLQMGLVCMFSLGWYFVPSLAIVEILLQMRVDAYNLTCTSQRPTPTPAETVGSWGLLMDAMSLLAVFTNAGIVCYTTKSLKTYSSNEKLLFFFVFEQLLLLAKMITHVLIPDCPPELYAIKKRQEHVVDRHKNVVFDDDDDDDDDEGDGLRKGNVDRSSVRSGHGHDDEGAAGLSALVLNRIQYLEAKLKACDSDITIARSQYKVACRTEIFNEETGVSYSRKTPGLALGMVTLTVLEAENIGSRHDPVDPKSCRIIVHIRDTTPKHDRKYEGNPGPAPQVSKPAKKPPKSNEMTEEQRTSGVRMVFNQSFSLAPIKTMKAEIYIEIMDNSKRVRRGTTTQVLSDLSNQRKQSLTLSVARPQGQHVGPQEPAVLYVKVQFQYSRILPIKRRIYMLLDEQRKLVSDRTNLRLGKDAEHLWDFPDDGVGVKRSGSADGSGSDADADDEPPSP